jgi:hypothetical protein
MFERVVSINTQSVSDGEDCVAKERVGAINMIELAWRSG